MPGCKGGRCILGGCCSTKSGVLARWDDERLESRIWICVRYQGCQHRIAGSFHDLQTLTPRCEGGAAGGRDGPDRLLVSMCGEL